MFLAKADVSHALMCTWLLLGLRARSA